MTRVVADITMSLDGFVTGPNPSLTSGLGDGGELLHEWAFSDDPVDAEILRTAVEATGAVVMGRRLFDIIDGPGGWNDEVGYGGDFAAKPPFFVVTHQPPERVRLDLDFTFVPEGPAAAIDRARDAAGGKDVVVMGGGDVIAQSLADGLLDELSIHLAPMVLGGGTPLFKPEQRCSLVQTAVRPTSTATHIAYRVQH